MDASTPPRGLTPPSSPASLRPSPSAVRRTASTGNLVSLRRRVVATVAEAEAELAASRDAPRVSLDASTSTTPPLTPRGLDRAESSTGLHARSLSDRGSLARARPPLPRAVSLGAGLSEWRREANANAHTRSGSFHDRSQSLASIVDAPSVFSFHSGPNSTQLNRGTSTTGNANFALPEHRTFTSGQSTRPIFQNLWGHEGRFLKHVFTAATPTKAKSNGSSAQTSPSTVALSALGPASALEKPRLPPAKGDTGSVGNNNTSVTDDADPSSSAALTAAALARHGRAHHLLTLFATEEVLPQLRASEAQLPRLLATAEQSGGVPSVRHRGSLSVGSASGRERFGDSMASIGGVEVVGSEEMFSLAHSLSSTPSCAARKRHDGDGKGGGGSGGGDDDSDGEGGMRGSDSDASFLYAPANFTGFRSRNLNALHANAWDRRLFLPTTSWCLTRFFSLFASPRFWEKLDWTVRGSIFTILPTMVLCLEPTTSHIFPLPTSVVSYAFWFSQPTFGAGLRELYVVIKGFSVSLVVFCIFLAIRPGPVWLSLLLMFIFVLLISFFAEQTKRTSAWCLCSLTMQYTRTPATTTFKFIGDYYVTLLIGIGFGLASFIVPYIRWSSVNAEHYLAVVADSISLSSRGMCACLWTPTPIIRQLHLARLRQLRATTEKSFAKMKTAISEMGYEPHRGAYTALIKTRSAFFTQIFYLQRSVIQMLEEVGLHPACLDTPLCRAFAILLGPALVCYGAALDDVLVAIGRVDEPVSGEALEAFRTALKTFEDAITAARETVVLNNPDYQTDESDILVGFYLFHLMEMGRLTADFKESAAPPNNLMYLLRLPERDMLSVVNACRALAFSLWQRHTITRRLKESIKLALCLFIAGIFQVYAMDNEGTSPIGGVDIIAWVYRDTGGESFTYSTHRLLGTVLGSLTGLLGVQIAGTRRAVLYVLELILCFIGTYIMASPGWAALGSAMTMSVVSMTMQFRNSSAAMVRIQQNCFAILIYFILSSFIWPVKARNKMKLGLDLSLRSFREVVWRLFRNLDLPESEADVAADASLLLTQMQKRISVQESNLAGATGEPTFDSAEFPATEWRTIILDQRHLMLSLLSMRFAYHTFMSSTVDGALSVHWRVLHRMQGPAAEFSELVFAACDIYLLALCRATLLPTAHLTRIREALNSCYEDMLRAYLTTIHQVLRGDFDDIRLAPDETDGDDKDKDKDKGERGSGAEDGDRTGAPRPIPGPARPPTNGSFTDFNLSMQEVNVLRQLLRLHAQDPSQTTTMPASTVTIAGATTTTTTTTTNNNNNNNIAPTQPPTRINSALNTGPQTVNNTFAGPPLTSVNNSFFPGAFSLDGGGGGVDLHGRPRSLQRVHGLLNRSFLARHVGGEAEMVTNSAPFSPITGGGGGGGGSPPTNTLPSPSFAVTRPDPSGPAFTLNSSILLPRGSYVPRPPSPLHARRPPAAADQGSLVSNMEDVFTSLPGSPDTVDAPIVAPDRSSEAAATPPVKRLSRLLSRLRSGGPGSHAARHRDTTAATAHAADDAADAPAFSPASALSSPPAPSPLDDDDDDAPASSRHRSTSPPTPHNFTFVGHSGLRSGGGGVGGLNASFIPSRALAAAVVTEAGHDPLELIASTRPRGRRAPAAGSGGGGGAGAVPSRSLDTTTATVDLFDLTRGRRAVGGAGGAGGEDRPQTAVAPHTPHAGEPRLTGVTDNKNNSDENDHGVPDDAHSAPPTRVAVAATNHRVAPPPPSSSSSPPPAPPALTAVSLTLPHSPTQVPSTLLVPLVPNAQFHSEVAESSECAASPTPARPSCAGAGPRTNEGEAGRAYSTTPAVDEATRNDEADVCGGDDDDDDDNDADALPPAVLSSRDIHSLESFLYGINSVLKQLDQFEQHLLEVVHANEMAKKL